MIEDVKRIPYGVSNFVEVVEQNQYYVDKTMYLPLLEQQPNSLFFIRPRRFGKSIFLSMLRTYYDISQKEKFQKRFGNLWIGSQPTPLQGTFQILFLDFSRIGGIDGTLAQNFDDYCCGGLDDFASIYEPYYYPGFALEMKQLEGSTNKLNFLDRKARNNGSHLYLIIDEYDNFTNVVLNEQGNEIYHALTHASGFYREIFKKFKGMFERIFMTGVSPVTLDDLTSGFNIGTNYSLSPEFNEMTGFTEKEVREMLTYYSTNSPFNHTVGQLIDIMKPWYDNYCFAPECYGETTLYNSNMVLYFVKNYILRGKAPQKMIESNIRIDYEKLRMLIRKDKEFAHDASIIQTLVSQGYITGELKDSFPAANIVDPDNFISLLYYFGMLTISGMHKGKNKLTIPNQVVEEQLYTYLLNTYNEADLSFSSYEKDELASALAYDGNWQAYFGYIADCLKRYASQRDKQKGEFFVHGFTLAMTAQNRFYRPISEADTQEGYADLFLCPLLEIYPDMKHSYIIELKYAKYKDSESRVEELRLEGIAQANRYADSDRVKNAVGTTQLHKIVVVYKGMEMRVCEEIVPLHETYN